MLAINKHGLLTVLTVLMSICHLPNGCWGNLINPPSRKTQSKRGLHVPYNELSTSPICGGNSQQELSLSGHPFQRGVVCGFYVQGSHATFEVDETALEPGYIEFKICESNTPNFEEYQDCFNKHPVYLSDGSGTRYYIAKDRKVAKVDVLIPPNLECSYCILQYHYYKVPVVTEKPCKDSCGQTEIYGCSDIAISKEQFQGQFHEIDGIIIKRPTNINTGTIFPGIKNIIPGFPGQPNIGQIGGTFGSGSITSVSNQGFQHISGSHGSTSVIVGSTNNGGSPISSGNVILDPGFAGPKCVTIKCKQSGIQTSSSTSTTTTTTATVSIGRLIQILQSIALGNSAGTVQIQITQPTIYRVGSTAFNSLLPNPPNNGVYGSGASSIGHILTPVSSSSGNNHAWTQEHSANYQYGHAAVKTSGSIFSAKNGQLDNTITGHLVTGKGNVHNILGTNIYHVN